MKPLIIICLLLLSGYCSEAQRSMQLAEAAKIPSWQLEVTWHKTTLLIFPAAVQSADRGDAYILAEKVPGVENVLKVKAGEKDFPASNLHVLTTDGKVYAFTLNYAEEPAELTIDMRRQRPYVPVTFKGTGLNSGDLETLSKRVAGSLPFLKGGIYKKHKLRFGVTGIYIKDNVLFFQYQLHNSSQLPLREGSLRFYIRDRKRAKRTAMQDKELEPLFIARSGSPEDSKGQTIVVAFPQFTIAEGKLLHAELMEAGGDRNPVARTTQRKLLRTKSL